jgi:hypothetical protein
MFWWVRVRDLADARTREQAGDTVSDRPGAVDPDLRCEPAGEGARTAVAVPVRQGRGGQFRGQPGSQRRGE